MKYCLLVVMAVVVLTACGGGGDRDAREDGRDPAALEKLAERGQEIFRDRGFGEAGIACMDCHADYDESTNTDGRIRAGHPILGAHRRAQTWNGEFSGDALARTAAGAAKCAWQFQARGQSIESALSADDAAALMAFYEYISPVDEPPMLNWTAVTYPGDPDFDEENFKRDLETVEVLRGDAKRGEKVFGMACAFCHDNELGPAQRKLSRKPERVPRTVRAGDDTMPFFSRDKLTDQDVADLKAFIAR